MRDEQRVATLSGPSRNRAHPDHGEGAAVAPGEAPLAAPLHLRRAEARVYGGQAVHIPQQGAEDREISKVSGFYSEWATEWAARQRLTTKYR